jgi:predicted MFS family arabinose efflux permease
MLMIGAGRLLDRFGAVRIGAAATALLIAVTFFGFGIVPSPLPIVLIFVGFMSAMGVRGVVTSAIASRVPRSHERARFVSLMSVFQHAASAIGAFLSALILSTAPDGSLRGMDRVAHMSICFSALIMVFMIPLERRLDQRARTVDVA